MKDLQTILFLAVVMGAAAPGRAQEPREASATRFDTAASDVQSRLDASLEELSALREDIAAEKIPLDHSLNELESELSQVRLEFRDKTRMLNTQALELNNLRADIKSRREEATYLSNLLADYLRNFESRLHIAEIQRYEAAIEAARRAAEDSSLSEQEVFAAQLDLLSTSMDRLSEALGGMRFDGSAVAGNGLVRDGTFAMIGPIAVFRSKDGNDIGTAEQRLGSLEPTVIAFADPEDAAAAVDVVRSGAGDLPVDTSLGNAHKIDSTQESFVEHVKKGGPVMIPIFLLAGAALLVALLKWLGLAFLRKPSTKQVDALLHAVEHSDRDDATRQAQAMGGPTGKMLAKGIEHMDEPRELVEEVMYEEVLTTRHRTQSFLPFVAICAASAPLLGLLGTVTGIINTFKLITVFGSQDVKMLSGGISEALITTKFGLIVAIPSLLIHAYLTRKARRIVGHMEHAAVSFVNQISKLRKDRSLVVETAARPHDHAAQAVPDQKLVRAQVSEILEDMLGPLLELDDRDGQKRAQGAKAG